MTGRMRLRWGCAGTVLAATLLVVSPVHTPAAQGATAGRIAFASWGDAGRGIFVMDADGSHQTRLTHGGDFLPMWSPDGCWITFLRGYGSVFVMGADGRDQRQVDVKSGENPENDLRAYFSPDGSRIVFSGSAKDAPGRPHGGRDVFVVNRDGSNPVNLTQNAPGVDAQAPRWSPDGSKILFSVGRDLYVMGADGRGRRKIGSGLTGVWSPDGSQIAAVGGDREAWARGTITLLQASGANPRMLTTNFSIPLAVTWSPDGRRLALKAIRGNDDIVLIVLDVAGGQARVVANQLSFSMTRDGDPIAWSPDGRRIAFSRLDMPPGEARRANRMPGADIYTVAADGSDLKRLTTTGKDHHPTWSVTCAKR